MNIVDILKLKFPGICFLKDVSVQDHGDGELGIGAWNLPSECPTNDMLKAWAVELNLLHRQTKAAEARIYPSIVDQLDMIYKDQLNGTSVFHSTIKAVKDASPKPLI
jgi:hypothetical protein